MSAFGPDQLAGRRARARASLVPVALAALAAVVAAACSDSSTGTKTTNCANYPCQVPATASVGDTVLLNVRVPGGAALDNVGTGTGACDAPNLIKARIAATSNRAVIAIDTRNPTGGLSDAYYASIAQTFDTLVYPVDVRHFGAPSADIDHNGRVVIFYTRAVNGLTPANSAVYVGGFFYARDLFPTTGTGACLGSNAAELFYLLAPDPTGAINGNKRDTAFIRNVTVGTMAHEFQHLISAERRLYILNTDNFDEEVWLNEGMSHIAEELNFYRSGNLSTAGQPGQSPRSRLTAAKIRSANDITPLNNFGFQNLSRFSYYLNATEQYGPYTDNDSLETRGATWSFLRYALDRAGSTDSALTYALVNSTNTGITNLRAVLQTQGGTSAGLPLETWFRDWAVANVADDSLVAPASQYTYPSWVFRNVLTQFQTGDGTTYFNDRIYPLATRTLTTTGGAQTLSLPGGGAAYFLFSAPAGSNASVQVTTGGTAALPNTVRLALVQRSGANAGTVTTVDGTGTGPGTISLANTSGTPIQAALVVFNSATPATATQTISVSESSTGLPSPSVVASTLSVGGPTVAAARAAAASGPIMSDAALMRRLRDVSRSTLVPRAAAARVALVTARRTGDYRAWSRQAYLPGTVKGAVVPYVAATTGGVAH